jgi:hypothetical protein
MPRITIVRYSARPERAAENEALSRAVFRELRATRPDGFTYALFREGDDFLHLFVNYAGDDAAVLTETPAFKAFSADASTRYTAPPEITRLAMTLVDSYGHDRALAPA